MMIEVRYLHRRYNGDPRTSGPSPSRLFQAMVAAAGTRRDDGQTEMLHWLERQPPPTMTFGPLGSPTEYTTFGTSASAPHAVEGIAEAWSPWLDDRRGTPDATYAWQSDPPDESAVRRLVDGIDVLGRGGDHAYARYRSGYSPPVNDHNEVVWVPADDSGKDSFRVPFPGLLDMLDNRYEARRRALTRHTGNGKTILRVAAVDPISWREMRYQRIPAKGETVLPVSRQWTVFDLSTPNFPTDTCRLCGALRHFTAEVIRQDGLLTAAEVDLMVLGHASAQNRPCATDWLSYFALPSLSEPYPDGMVRRLMVAAPRSQDPIWKKLIKLIRRRLTGTELRGKLGSVYARLSPGTVDTTVLAYVGPNQHWTTATPALIRGGSARRRRGGSLRPGAARVERRRDKALQGTADDFERSNGVGIELRISHPGVARPRAAAYHRKSHHQNYLRAHLTARTSLSAHGPLAVGHGTHAGFGLLVGTARRQGDSHLIGQ